MTFFGAERFSEKKWSITAEYFSEEIKATRTLKFRSLFVTLPVFVWFGGSLRDP